ncbi:MAG: 1-deoxy-D-xylulose-5-phosphate reductoisomerase, partial [Thermoguttaceae bacterium]
MPHRMAPLVTNIAILGSTGSIGRNTLEVIGSSGGTLRALALSAHTSAKLLFEQAGRFWPRWVVLSDADSARRHDRSELPPGVELLVGPEGITRIVTDPEVHTVVSAIVGSAGLEGTWAALEAGKTVALANKETLVVAGPLVMRLAQEKGARILPVDSEHSAIFQAMQAGGREEVRRVILTA